MLMFRSAARLPVVIGVVVAAGLAGWLVFLREPALDPPLIDSVTVSKGADGSASLRVAGQGLRDDLEALLIPNVKALGPGDSRVGLPISLYQLASDGRLAVATTRDQRLLALDVTTGRPPKVLGGVKLRPSSVKTGEFPVTATVLIGSKVVVGKAEDGLLLVDVADPVFPREIDQLQFSGGVSEMEVANGVVYVARQRAGLMVATIEDNRLRTRKIGGDQFAWRIAVAGRRLVVAGQKGELTFYDLDGKGWPRPVGRGRLSQEIRDLVLAPESMYACTADNRLLEFSLKRWPQLIQTGQCDLRGKPMRLALSENAERLFCTLISRGVAMIDVRHPGAPTLAGLIAMPRMPVSLQISGDRLLTAGIGGLWIYTAEQLETPQLAPEILQPFSSYNSSSYHGKYHLLPWQDAIFAYDLDRLVLLSAKNSAAPGKNREHQGNAPFLALPDRAGVRLYALRDGMPSTQVIGHIPINDMVAPAKSDIAGLSSVHDAFWQAGRLYVLSDVSLKIFDGNSAGTTTLLGEYLPPAGAMAMGWLEPGFVAMIVSGKGLQIVDVRNPTAPKLIGAYALPAHLRTVGISYDMLVDGRRLFVARARLGVEVYDLSNPAAPALIQRIDTPGSAGSLSLANGLLMVSDQDRGVYIIDVRGRFGLPVGSYPLATIAREVLSHGDTLFVADSVGGVQRLPAPQRLVSAREATNHGLEWSLPAKASPGRYTLAVYGTRGTTNFPVVLQ